MNQPMAKTNNKPHPIPYVRELRDDIRILSDVFDEELVKLYGDFQYKMALLNDKIEDALIGLAKDYEDKILNLEDKPPILKN